MTAGGIRLAVSDQKRVRAIRVISQSLKVSREHLESGLATISELVIFLYISGTNLRSYVFSHLLRT